MDDIEERIRLAKYGCVSESKKLLAEFVGYVSEQTGSNGKALGGSYQIDHQIMQYLAECFQNILNGESPKKALNLNPDGKEPDPLLKQKRLEMHLEVESLISEGKSVTEAIGIVADNYYPDGKADRAVSDAYYNQNLKMVAAILKRLPY